MLSLHEERISVLFLFENDLNFENLRTPPKKSVSMRVNNISYEGSTKHLKDSFNIDTSFLPLLQ